MRDIEDHARECQDHYDGSYDEWLLLTMLESERARRGSDYKIQFSRGKWILLSREVRVIHDETVVTWKKVATYIHKWQAENALEAFDLTRQSGD